ncbi:unnamed protein product [Mucor hiemalis]
MRELDDSLNFLLVANLVWIAWSCAQKKKFKIKKTQKKIFLLYILFLLYMFTSFLVHIIKQKATMLLDKKIKKPKKNIPFVHIYIFPCTHCQTKSYNAFG